MSEDERHTHGTDSIMGRLNPAGIIRGSFRAKLFAVTTAAILLVSFVFTLFFAYHQHRSQQDKLITEGKLLTRLLAHTARLSVFAGNGEQLHEVAMGVMNAPDVLSVTISDRKGRVLVHLTRKDKAGLDTAAPAAGAPEPSGLTQTWRKLDRDSIEFSEPIVARLGAGNEEGLFFATTPAGDPEIPIGVAKVVLDGKKSRKLLQDILLTALAAAAVFLAAGMAASFLVFRSIMRPLVHLTEGVKSLESGQHDIQIPIESDDEIGRLATAFNRMVAALQRRRRKQKEAEKKISDLNAHLEEKVRQRTTQLELANRELESFNYSASHDLRAPLTRLSGYCQAMKEDYGDRLDEEGKRYLRRIAAAGEQMDRVVSSMTALYKIQQEEIVRREINLSEIVRAIVAVLRETEPGREVTLRVEQNVLAEGDMKLLWIALENIIGNAWKFTARTPGALIEFGRTRLGDETVFFVRDNGAGFDMAYAGKLFQPFERLHAADDYPGTGVGLTIVQRIITRHEGRVWLESAEGTGTTCRFSLPRSGSFRSDETWQENEEEGIL